MALFPGVTGNMYFKGKTHTGLVVSEGNAPAEKFIVSKTEGTKFNYMYGPEGNQNVVIAKGKAVEIAGMEYEYDTSSNVPAIKVATDNSVKVIGLNHHNLYERLRDRFSGNQPTIITRQYVELPLFEHTVPATAAAAADTMKFGAVYGATGGLVHGDYVVTGLNGNLRKFVSGTDSAQAIVGQVWAVEKEIPPLGLLSYFLDLKVEEIEAFMKASSYAPSPGKNDPALGYSNPNAAGDAGAYPTGYPWTLHQWQAEYEKLLNPVINKGIPFLTDGYFKAKTVATGIALDDIYDATTKPSGHIESVVFSGGVTFGHDVTGTFTPSTANVVDKGVQTAAGTRNNALFIKLRNPIDRVEAGNIVVKLDGVNAAAADVHIDYYNNMVVIYLDAGKTVSAVTIDAKLVVDPVAGIPTEWDYAGAVGAVRILLQK
jgi:hypothetical protein